MFGFTYNMLCQSSRKRRINQEARHESKKQKKCAYFRNLLMIKTCNRAKKPYKRSQKISLKERGFASLAMGPLRPHTGAKGSRTLLHKKNCNNNASSANEKSRKELLENSRNNASSANEKSRKELLEKSPNNASSANEKSRKASNKKSRIALLENRPIYGRQPTFSEPFRIGYYSPGTEPNHIPYHLYLLVKEAVEIMKRFEWFINPNDRSDLSIVENKIDFFCFYFYSHLPKRWNYKRDMASSLIAGYDTIFAEGRPRYLMSGYTPLGDYVKKGCDWGAQLWSTDVVDIMRIVHSRKTPAHETFMGWGRGRKLFYRELCSCFDIDYQHLETASDDDVCLMNMDA